MEELNKKSRTIRKNGIIAGIILVLAGIILLGINFGILPAEIKIIVFSWPVILIVLGIFYYFGKLFYSGSILLISGIFFLMPRVITAFPQVFRAGLEIDFVKLYWPVLLIAAGILVIIHIFFRPKRKSHREHWENHCKRHFTQKSIHSDNETQFSKNAVFGSGEHIVLDPVFTGGEVEVAFSGVTIDLRKTALPQGDSFIDISAFFSGVVLLIPESWFVKSQMDAIFGGIHDKRHRGVTDESSRLILTGSCAFSGVEIKS